MLRGAFIRGVGPGFTRCFGAAATLAGALALTLLSGCAVQTAALLEAPPADLPPRVELTTTPFFPQTELHCGPAALATALGAVGVEVSPATLVSDVFLPARAGSLQVEMLASARRHGAVATRIPGRLQAVLGEVAAGHVVVVLQNLGLSFVPRWHYAVVVGYDLGQGELLMRSGITRRDRISLRTFEHTWARSGHWAFVVTAPGRWPQTVGEPAAVDAAIGFERSATPARALQVYASGLARWPGSLPLAIGLGTAAHATGDVSRAIEVFRRAGEQHGSGAAWLNLATLLWQEGRQAQAVEAAQRALQDPLWSGPARDWLAGRAVDGSRQPTMRP